MGVLEGCCLTAVLLLALYGAAHFVTWAVWRVLRPPTPRMVLLVTVDGRDTELQLRFAKATAERIGVSFRVRAEHPDRDTADMIQRLCGDGWTEE